MATDRDSFDDARRERGTSADDDLDRALEAAAEDETEGPSDDAAFDSFLDRYPAAVRAPGRPKSPRWS